MIPDKMEGIGGYRLIGYEAFGRLAIVWELKQMQHLGMLFTQDRVPGVFGYVCQLTTDGMVPHLPMGAGKDRIGIGNRSHLVFCIGGKHLGGDDLRGQLFLLGIFLPFHVSNFASTTMS